ncbi:MAG: DUF4430 domain-containing protein, partial [Clostridiales bacterium]|nr:DUF4430 domain-containing protein [Clostridiales bacterium]
IYTAEESEKSEGLLETDLAVSDESASDESVKTENSTAEASTAADSRKQSENNELSDYGNDETPASSSNSEKAVETTAAASTAAETTTENKNVVTISISCGTILNNSSKLKTGKELFVPSDGIILNEYPIEFSQNITAFDVLKQACDENDIQLEFSYSGGFGTYYIEGINQLYEKDCGSKSGWMYSVNGVFPSVGCSSYTLETGDIVAFVYTCDNGEDVGA